MALWQITFNVLQKESVDSFNRTIDFIQDEEGFDNEPYWRYKPINRSLFFEIGSILCPNKSWSKHIDLYGKQESNCFEVLFDDNNIVIDVSFRIDFRGDFDRILTDIIEFCIYKDLIILDDRLNALPLNYTIILNTITNAPQVGKYIFLSGNTNNTD